MTRPRTDYDAIDDAALAVGLGLVVFGAAVLGFFETLLGSAHVSQRIAGIGIVVLHTSFSPRLRASLIALGFLVLVAWALYRAGSAIVSQSA